LEPVGIIMENYQYVSQYKVSGSVGAQLAKLFSITLSGEDVIAFKAPLGKIMSQRVSVPILNKILDSHRVNLNHPCIQQAKDMKDKILCIVSEVLYVEKEAELTATVNWKISGNVNSSPPKVLNSSAQGEGSINKDNSIEMRIEAGTRLGYRIHPIEIDSEGRVRIFNLYDAEMDLSDTQLVNKSSSFVNSLFMALKPHPVAMAHRMAALDRIKHALDVPDSPKNLILPINPMALEFSILRCLRDHPNMSVIHQQLSSLMEWHAVAHCLQKLGDAIHHFLDGFKNNPTKPIPSIMELPFSMKKTVNDGLIYGNLLSFLKLLGLDEVEGNEHSMKVTEWNLSLLEAASLLFQALHELPERPLVWILRHGKTLIDRDVLYIFFLLYDIIRGVPLDRSMKMYSKLDTSGVEFCQVLGITKDLDPKELPSILYRKQFEPLLLFLFIYFPDVEILF
jgi:hypothetical protein